MNYVLLMQIPQSLGDSGHKLQIDLPILIDNGFQAEIIVVLLFSHQTIFLHSKPKQLIVSFPFTLKFLYSPNQSFYL
jgi:hypothetical protein